MLIFTYIGRQQIAEEVVKIEETQEEDEEDRSPDDVEEFLSPSITQVLQLWTVFYYRVRFGWHKIIQKKFNRFISSEVPKNKQKLQIIY